MKVSEVEAYMNDCVEVAPEWRTLEDLRPRRLRDLIGNEPVAHVIGQCVRNGHVPRRVFLFGPSGSGKTTLAHILARCTFCENAKGIGDACGQCSMCKTDIYTISSFHEWTGAEVDEGWAWWQATRTGSFMDNPRTTLFIDESQGIPKKRQKEWHRFVETFKGRMLFATTHKHEMDDALVNRFEPYVLEMRRPTHEQAVGHLDVIRAKIGAAAEHRQLAWIVQHYGCDLRKCVAFLYAAANQAPGRTITDDLIRTMLWLPPAIKETEAPDVRVKL